MGRLFVGGYRPIGLILQNTREADFVRWLEEQPHGLSAESHGWKDGRFVIVCVYPDDPDDTGTLSTQRETIKVRVLPNQIDTTEIEVVCRPTASIPRRFLLAIAKRWPGTRDAIAAFIGESEIAEKRAERVNTNSWKLKKPFDILDASIARHLRAIPIPDWFEFRTQSISPGAYVVHVVHCNYMGQNMGVGQAEIGLRKMQENLTELYTTDTTDDDLTGWLEDVNRRYQDGKEVLEWKLEREKEYEQSVVNRQANRAAYHEVIAELIEKLKQDRLFVEADETPQPATTAQAETTQPAGNGGDSHSTDIPGRIESLIKTAQSELLFILKDKPYRLVSVAEGIRKRRAQERGPLRGQETPLELEIPPAPEDTEKAMVHFTRFQAPGKGHAEAVRRGDGQTLLRVTPIDARWEEYPNQDGWAMLYADLNLLALIEPLAASGAGEAAQPPTLPQFTSGVPDIQATTYRATETPGASDATAKDGRDLLVIDKSRYMPKEIAAIDTLVGLTPSGAPASNAGRGEGQDGGEPNKRARERGPSPEDLETCRNAMILWLDKHISLRQAAENAEGGPISHKTVQKWIPNVLETIDDIEKRQRWIGLIKAQKKENYLGKFR